RGRADEAARRSRQRNDSDAAEERPVRRGAADTVDGCGDAEATARETEDHRRGRGPVQHGRRGAQGDALRGEDRHRRFRRPCRPGTATDGSVVVTTPAIVPPTDGCFAPASITGPG